MTDIEDEPSMTKIKAIDIRPGQWAVWCTVDEGKPFANTIELRRWSDDGESIWFMLDSHNTLNAKPDEELELVPCGRPRPKPDDQEAFLARRPRPQPSVESLEAKLATATAELETANGRIARLESDRRRVRPGHHPPRKAMLDSEAECTCGQ